MTKINLRKILQILILLTLSIVLSLTFYQTYLCSIWILPLIYLLKPKALDFKRDEIVFLRAFLTQIYSELTVGTSFRMATLSAIKHTEKQTVEALSNLEHHLLIGMGDYEAWSTFEQELSNKSLSQFVKILEHAQYSGSFQSVLQKTIYQMNERLDMDIDIGVAIAAKRFEFYAMMLTPIGLLIFLEVSNRAYMLVLFTTLLGRISMTVTFLSMLIAYVIGKNIIRIEV